MYISVEWKEGKYPSFNVSLHAKEGTDAFFVIKSCSIMKGQKGDFVKYPSVKMQNGNWFNYVYATEKFNEAVLAKARESMPESGQAPKGKSVQDMDDDLPW